MLFYYCKEHKYDLFAGQPDLVAHLPIYKAIGKSNVKMLAKESNKLCHPVL